MSVPFYVFAPTTVKVVKPAFTAEKQHMILAVDNSIIPTSVAYLEFTSAGDYATSFGRDAVYSALIKYFGFLSKSGTAPDKAVIMRWFKDDTAPFAVGTPLESTALTTLKAITDGSIGVTLDGTSYQVDGLDFSDATSLSGCAEIIQAGIRKNTTGGEAFTLATVSFSSITNGFIVTGGKSGKGTTISTFVKGSSGTDILGETGLQNAKLSQGVDAESFDVFCARVFDANPAGFTITTLEEIENEDIKNSCAYLQQVVDGQSLYTNKKITINFKDKDDLLSISEYLKENSFTGITLTYDPKEENVNILDAAVTASTDYLSGNSTKNYNFQPATGYTSITEFGLVTDFQSGVTNIGLYNELNKAGACFVYSIGYGSQKQTYYGAGAMVGVFGTEDVQANQAALESSLQLAIVNGLSAVEKLKLRGNDAENALSGLVDPSFKMFQSNGAIAYNGSLSDNDKLTIVQSFGSSDVADAIENNGYYFQIEELTDVDISSRQRRVKYAYLAGGVINRVVFSASIYGV